MRSVKVYQEAWPLHSPFVIARGSRSEAVVVVVELEEDGVRAVGECTPYPRYGESVASVMAQIMTVVPQLEAGLDRAGLQKLLPAGAARNAVDCALWDLDARARATRWKRIYRSRCRSSTPPPRRSCWARRNRWRATPRCCGKRARGF